jgi:LytS/YehU family sensor histidine kinase
MVPKMTVQTFVENAIRHGFEHRKTGGRVDIEILSRDSNLEIIITDNGIGREAALKQHSSGTGRGLRTITDIFDMMNKFNRCQARVEITDLLKDGVAAGTMGRIVIPDDYNYDNYNNY